MGRHKINETFPRYFRKEDVPIKVFVNPNTGYVAALNDLGNPEDIAVAVFESVPITEQEFNRMAAKRAKELPKIPERKEQLHD